MKTLASIWPVSDAPETVMWEAWKTANVTQGPSCISHKATWGSNGLCPFYPSMTAVLPRVLRPFRPRPAQCELMIARIRSLQCFAIDCHR